MTKRCPGWNERGLAAIMAVRWTSFGNPVAGSQEALFRVLADFWCVSPEEAEKRWWDAAQLPYKGRLFYEFVDDSYDLVVNHSLLYPLRDNFLRVNHNFGLHAEDSEREDLVDALLAEGLRPQPAGRGKWSEAPHLIFGIGDYPPGETHDSRRYNPYYPWVTVELPLEDEELVFSTGARRTGTGGIVTLWQVPPQYIIAMNGFPVRSFVRMRQMLGR